MDEIRWRCILCIQNLTHTSSHKKIYQCEHAQCSMGGSNSVGGGASEWRPMVGEASAYILPEAPAFEGSAFYVSRIWSRMKDRVDVLETHSHRCCSVGAALAARCAHRRDCRHWSGELYSTHSRRVSQIHTHHCNAAPDAQAVITGAGLWNDCRLRWHSLQLNGPAHVATYPQQSSSLMWGFRLPASHFLPLKSLNCLVLRAALFSSFLPVFCCCKPESETCQSFAVSEARILCWLSSVSHLNISLFLIDSMW